MVPESPQSEGDGKNLAPLPHHLRRCADNCWQSAAFLPPSSFGSRYRRANNKTPSPESTVATDDLTILHWEPNSWPKHPISCAPARNNDLPKNDHLHYRIPDGPKGS